MANLIKELQLRYSPEGGSPRQVSHDYFAMFALWRAEGSGGDGGATSIGRSRLVDDVFRQVAEAMGLKYAEGRQLAGREVIKKDIGQLNHYLKMEDWMNFHGVVKDILRKTVVSTRFQELSKMETNPKAHLDDFSRMIRELVRSSRVLPDAPGASTKSEPEPAYKQFDKPLTAPPAALSPELPMKGAQMHLPLKPQEKIPVPDLTGVKPLGAPMAGDEPKQAPPMTEMFLKKYGYEWSEADKAYKNDARKYKIQFFPDNSVVVTSSSGKTKEFKNIGLLFRALAHNKKKRHPANTPEVPAGEPKAGVTTENFKMLYEFLYH